MPHTRRQTERRRSPGALTTVNEAAFVTGASKHAVNQAIDRGEIRTRAWRRKSDPEGRALGGPEILYMRVQKPLSPAARKEVYRQIAGLALEHVPPVLEVGDAVRLDIREPLAEVRSRLEELERIKSQVELNPEIRGGEPVFRDTRVPVHMIADFLAQGVSHDELLEDYPALSPELLEIARQYASLYPRRGRPRQASWRSAAPSAVFPPGKPGG